jgi:hypothetical protein
MSSPRATQHFMGLPSREAADGIGAPAPLQRRMVGNRKISLGSVPSTPLASISRVT